MLKSLPMLTYACCQSYSDNEPLNVRGALETVKTGERLNNYKPKCENPSIPNMKSCHLQRTNIYSDLFQSF